MENHDLINRYFENSLSPKEQKLFNDLLQNDASFKEEFLFQKNLKKVITISQQEELKASFSKVEANLDKNQGVLRIPKKWMIAASFLIFIGLSIWGVKSTYYPSNEAIYTAYFQADRNTVHPIVRGESIKTIEYMAFVAYESQDYYKAINLFNSVKSPDKTHIIYYKALCFLSLDKNDEAIGLFNKVISINKKDTNSSELKEKAKWYLALAYINKNEKDEAIDLLKEIKNNPQTTFKKQETEEILSFLE